MARMFPERLPEGVTSKAEHRLFDELSTGLDNHYSVFAGVRWVKKARNGAINGEADFVVVHPDKGILVLEVKGGGIAFDAPTGKWCSIDRYGDLHEIRNPAEQAQRNYYDLCDKIQEVDGRTQLRKSGGHAVAFPDSAVRSKDLGLDLPREIIIDSDDLGDIQNAVDRAFNYWQSGKAHQLSSVETAAIETTLARSWQITSTLKEAMRRENTRFAELTEEQFRLLDFLAGQHRALIAGCAGSGKTFLAAEKARRLANEGFNTLLTCYNKNLATWLRASLEPLPNLRIQHFHELAFELTQQAGTDTGPSGDDLNLYFRQTLPEALLDAADAVGEKFDAIVVDEGQDFLEEWWVPLQALLNDADRGVWYIFYDDEQSLYTDGAAPPFDAQPYLLNTNMRSTRAIHEHVKRFYSTPVSCNGPQGRAPTIVKTANTTKAVQSQLHRLMTEEKIPAEDIVILTPASQQRSGWKDGQFLGNVRLTWTGKQGSMQVPVSTIHGYKGLESPVVIVTEMDTISDYQPADRLRLVAYSRARNELIVVENGA